MNGSDFDSFAMNVRNKIYTDTNTTYTYNEIKRKASLPQV